MKRSKLIVWLFGVIMALGIAGMIPSVSEAAGNSMNNATEIKTGTSYDGSITNSNTVDYYKFTIGQSGAVKISITSFVNKMDYYLYDSDGNSLWSYTYVNLNENTETSVVNDTIHLTSGTYYLYIAENDYYDYRGDYSFKVGFTSAGESFKESGNGTNNLLTKANFIKLNTNYKGQIAKNDEKDFYKFTLSTAGRISINVTTGAKYFDYYLYNSGMSQMNHTDAESINENTLKSSTNMIFDLTAGTYYFGIIGDYYYDGGEYTGPYSMKIGFTNAGESFKEAQGGSNNTIPKASSIKLDTLYTGQIADNDNVDFYKFYIPGYAKYKVAFSAWFDYSRFEIYNSSNNEVYDSYNLYRDDNTGRVDYNDTIELSGGTYYFKVYSYYENYTGNYKFKIWQERNMAYCTIKGLANKTYTGSAIRQNVAVYWGSTLLREGTDYILSYYNNVNVGTCTLGVIGRGSYSGYKQVYFSIYKAPQKLTVKTTNKTVARKKVKRHKKTLKSPFKIKSKKGKVTYKKLSGSKKITVNKKNGKITVKKGTKKGTYKIRVRVRAAGNSNYKSASKVVKIKVRVK